MQHLHMTKSQKILCQAAGAEGMPSSQQMLAIQLLETCLFVLAGCAAGCAAGPQSDLGIVGFSSFFLCVFPALQSCAMENLEHPLQVSIRGVCSNLPNLAHHRVTAEQELTYLIYSFIFFTACFFFFLPFPFSFPELPSLLE